MLRLPRTFNANTVKAFSRQSSKIVQNRQFSVLQKANTRKFVYISKVKPVVSSTEAFINPIKRVVTPKPLGASKIIALATISSVTTPLVFSKPVHCEAAYAPSEGIQDVINENAAKYNKQPIFRKGELTFGTFLGLCTGYLIKKVGKIFALFVGTGFVFLQYMSQKGYVTVHWDRLEGGYSGALDVDRDGKVTRRDLSSKWNSLTGFLTNNIQFKSTFLIGFYAGIRYG